MKTPSRPSKQPAKLAAFTLIEIMVVIGIIALIATMAVPAMNSVLKGSKMTEGSDEFEREVARARAAAMRENAPIEFRFYEMIDPETPNSVKAYRAYQAVKRVRASDDHTETVDIIPLSEVKMLPPGIVFSENQKFSTLLHIRDIPDNTATDHGDYDDSLPRYENASYKAFYFRPDGSTNLATIDRTKKWCVTVRREIGGEDDLPPDFVSFQIDAFNGQVRRYEKRL